MTIAEIGLNLQKFGFDPELEQRYLGRLRRPERRRSALNAEVATAVGEAVRFTFDNRYGLDGGRIMDKKSGEPVGEVLGRGGNGWEKQAFGLIEQEMNQGGVAVNISPANEDLHYPKAVVDVWEREGPDGVRWRRMTVENNFGELREIYRTLTGEGVKDEWEMLANPIAMTREKVDYLLTRLRATVEPSRVRMAEIEETVRIIASDFIERFGDRLFEDKELIFRLYSAAMAEVKARIRNGLTGVANKVRIGWDRLRAYALAQMTVGISQTYGCDNMTQVGFFGRLGGVVGNWWNSLVGRVKEYFSGTFDCPKCKGKIPKGKGIEVCPHCGVKKSDYGSKCD